MDNPCCSCELNTCSVGAAGRAEREVVGLMAELVGRYPERLKVLGYCRFVSADRPYSLPSLMFSFRDQLEDRQAVSAREGAGPGPSAPSECPRDVRVGGPSLSRVCRRRRPWWSRARPARGWPGTVSWCWPGRSSGPATSPARPTSTSSTRPTRTSWPRRRRCARPSSAAGTAAAGAGLASGYGRSSWESAARQIPAGWRRLVDPGSGRPYYANLQTNATQWELPTAVHTGLAPRQWAATVSGSNT